MAISDKLTYLNTTKQRLKDSINALGGDLDNTDTFRSYAEELDNIYTSLPKVEGEGSNLSLTPTMKGRLSITPKGNCEQDGTPTPDNPIDVKVVTGDNRAVACNKNFIDNTNLNYSWANVASSYIQLSTLDTGIRFESTFPSGAPVIAFKLFDLNNYIGKTIRMKSKMTSGGQYRLDLIDENATSVTPIQTASTSEQVLSYTVPNNLTDKHYLAFTLIDIVGTSRQIDFTDLILTIDDDDLTYVPHQEQSKLAHLNNLELCKIGDYQDVITGSKDNWKVVRKVRHLNLAIADMDNNESYPGWKISDNAPVMVDDLNLTSTNTYVDNITSYYSNIIKQTTGSQNLRVNRTSMWLPTGVFNLTQSQWKEQYPNLTFELYYGIANEQAQYEETITDTTLINELNGLQELLSYDGTTNITITSASGNAQMLVEASALKGE